MREFSDSELIAKTREGDNEAYGVLVKRYIDPLYAFVFRMSGEKDDAEDIVQEAFVKAWKKLGHFDIRRSFKPWLYTIARNAFLDSIKSKKGIPFSSFDTEEGNYIEDTAVHEAPGAGEMFDQELASRDLRSLIATLNGAYQIVIALHLEEGLTFAQISEILGEPIDTVKSRYRRACTKLKALIV